MGIDSERVYHFIRGDAGSARSVGNQKGYRKVLTLIVLWWSFFSGFTGMAGGFVMLHLILFMSGIGEAGASHCMT
jgi:hypothetical protein